jgi:hypothetical protein
VRGANWALACCQSPQELSGGPLYDLGRDVGARDTPSIRGGKKETMDRSLAAPLNLGGSLTDRRRPTLEPYGTNHSNSLRMYGLMYSSTLPNQSQS